MPPEEDRVTAIGNMHRKFGDLDVSPQLHEGRQLTVFGNLLAAPVEERLNQRERVSTNTKPLLESFDENVVINAVESGTEV